MLCIYWDSTFELFRQSTVLVVLIPLPAEGTRLNFLVPGDDVMFPFRTLTRLFAGSLVAQPCSIACGIPLQKDLLNQSTAA